MGLAHKASASARIESMDGGFASTLFAGPNVGIIELSDRNMAPPRYCIRPVLVRPRDMSRRTSRQPVRGESVTHVSGINRSLCSWNTREAIGGPAWIRTRDQGIMSGTLAA